MNVLRRIPYWVTLALLVYMPFHIFLAQSVSLVTGGLEAWKLGKDVVLAAAGVFTICLVWQQRRATKLFWWLVGLAVAYFVVHLLVWAAHADIYRDSALLGTLYNVRLPAFLVLGYGAALLNPGKFVFSTVLKLVLTISTVVAALGILQYFLPKDLLTHLGYSLERGVRPAFFIDDNPDLPRIMSTLREPNALGAYLLLPFAALTLLALRVKDRLRRVAVAAAWLLHGLGLLLTFSRSAWLGTVLAVGLVVWWQHSTALVRLLRRWWPLALVSVVVLVAVGFVQRDSHFVRSYITHAPPEAVEDLDSNDYHWVFVREGVQGALDQPLGHGPGTAGIVSIQNPAGSFLTENYYVQLAYEVGVVGLFLFIALSVVVYRKLYQRDHSGAAVLLASFWGYVLTNMLLHTWGNEAVAAQWWLLAGLLLASSDDHAIMPVRQK